jgi:hypothetical protein
MDRQDMVCRTCVFYEAPKKGEGTIGECRRYPPQMLVREIYDGHAQEWDARWTVVAPEEWCGEWRGGER